MTFQDFFLFLLFFFDSPNSLCSNNNFQFNLRGNALKANYIIREGNTIKRKALRLRKEEERRVMINKNFSGLYMEKRKGFSR